MSPVLLKAGTWLTEHRMLTKFSVAFQRRSTAPALLLAIPSCAFALFLLIILPFALCACKGGFEFLHVAIVHAIFTELFYRPEQMRN